MRRQQCGLFLFLLITLFGWPVAAQQVQVVEADKDGNFSGKITINEKGQVGELSVQILKDKDGKEVKAGVTVTLTVSKVMQEITVEFSGSLTDKEKCGNFWIEVTNSRLTTVAIYKRSVTVCPKKKEKEKDKDK